MAPHGDVIRSERLDLVLLPGAAMDALLAGQHGRVEAMLRFSVAASFPEEGDLEMLRFRRAQLAATPSWGPWLIRGIVRREDRTMVGLATFHGPPGINELGVPNAAEVGYTVNEQFRNRGYATETASAMLRWANRRHGITTSCRPPRPKMFRRCESSTSWDSSRLESLTTAN